MAGALARRGSLRRAFVVHGKDVEGKGLDEASIEGPTTVMEVADGRVAAPAVLVPRDLGLAQPSRHALRVHDRAEALAVARGLHAGSGHPDFRPAVADAVALQAGLGLLLHRGGALTHLPAACGEARQALERGFPLPFPVPGEVRP
jgi:anthranilate phosphoribosyltransferase